MEFLQSIKSAIKVKAPIVAIPVEGHAPVCVRQKLLKRALKGVEVRSIEVVTLSGGRRGLRVTGRAGADYRSTVKTSCTFAAIDRRTASNELSKWSAKEKLKVEKRIAQGALSAAEVRAARTS